MRHAPYRTPNREASRLISVSQPFADGWLTALPDGTKLVKSKKVKQTEGNLNKTFYSFGSNTNIKNQLRRSDLTMN